MAPRKKAAKKAPRKRAARKAPARKRYRPTAADRRRVEMLAGYGISQNDIGRMVGEKGITKKTLVKHFRLELDLGHPKAIAAMAQSLYQQGMGRPQVLTREPDGSTSVETVPVKPITAATIFWLKAQGGWTEPSNRPDLTDLKGEAIKGAVVLWLPDNGRDPNLPTET